ncbi:hypothetical protein C2R22_09855 [Salinigranum rubrum]|uniref:Uncharacterized protein n=1 Tax=Salinigranum rubrum TaxID=755307 RepID=A0A2I8VJ11_9EURY|nr:hypothetical protein [Salinigranum rubrum]AUV81916.1 hypothetical protein C2R22_09855 [Salinigranum rubrum]
MSSIDSGDCADRLRGLLQLQEAVIDEDLASLGRMPTDSRVERYRRLAREEEEFVFDYPASCPDQLTSAEREELRSRFRLARLFVYASFENRNEPVPTELDGDFAPVEVQAAIDFERYKSFDALSEEGIEERIRRMDGEVYTLAKEYHSTQLDDLDALLDDPTVQRDVLKQLVNRYDARLDKIKRAVQLYVEIHNPSGLVDSIERAITAVADSADEREAIREAIEREVQSVAADLDRTLSEREAAVDARLRTVEAGLDGRELSDGVREELDALRAQTAELQRTQERAVSDLSERIDRASQLDGRLTERIGELETAHERALADGGRLGEETVALVSHELDALREQHDAVAESIDALRRERQRIADAEARLDEREADLTARVEALSTALSETTERTGEGVVTTAMARLFELDYLGRFDISVHEAARLTTPEGAVEVPPAAWDGAVSRRDEVPRLRDYLGADGDFDAFPANRSVRFELGRSRYLGLGRERQLVLEASVVSHLEAYAHNGFDARPATVDDLLDVVTRAVRTIGDDDAHTVLALASPTGWTDDVADRLLDESFARNRFDRRLHLYLVDLQTGELRFDASDDLLAGNAGLFDVGVDAERLHDCVAVVRERADEGELNVRLDALTAEGYPAHVVKQAFNRLEREGVGQQLLLDELGLVLAFE